MTHIPTRHGSFPLHAWTGGSVPEDGIPDIPAVREAYSDLFNHLLQEQISVYEMFWEEPPPSDTLEIFTLRASGDAWATIREAGLVK